MNRLKLYTYRFLHILQIHIFQTLVVVGFLFFVALDWVGPLFVQNENRFWGYTFVFIFMTFMCLVIAAFSVAMIGREEVPFYLIPIRGKLAVLIGWLYLVPALLVLLLALIAYLWYAVIPLFYGFFQ